MEEPLIYREPGFVGMERVFLSDDEYALALETFIVPCTDTLIVDRKEKAIYLAKRKSKPAQDLWWMIGGRRKAGVQARDAMQEIFKRETSLTIDSARFEYVATIEYLFKDRQQQPQNKNQHTQGITFALELTQEERATVAANLDPQEYYTDCGLQKFSTDQLNSADHHPMIIELARRAIV